MIENRQLWTVSIYEVNADPMGLAFSFVPNDLTSARILGEIPSRVREYILDLRWSREGIEFDWGRTLDDPGERKTEFENEARRRVDARRAWIGGVNLLVTNVEEWARELSWETRRIDKRLDDSYIGKHRVTALLMQQETFRVLLEPVGLSGLGAEGIVDLYQLPAYDDIARLTYKDSQWNFHFAFQSDNIVGNNRLVQGVPLSKGTLRTVLDEMRIHAL